MGKGRRQEVRNAVLLIMGINVLWDFSNRGDRHFCARQSVSKVQMQLAFSTNEIPNEQSRRLELWCSMKTASLLFHAAFWTVGIS